MTTKRKSDPPSSGWTMAREIFGSFIGVLPFVLGIVGWVIYIESNNTARDKDIAYLKAADVQQDADRRERKAEVDRRLERLERKTEHLPAWGGQSRPPAR